MSKTCLKCGDKKPLEAFGTRTRNSDGKRGRCKDCEKEDRVKFEASPERKAKIKSYAKDNYWRNRDENIKRQKRWAAANKDKQFEYRRRMLLSKKYGITQGQYDFMARCQNYKCKICGTDKPDSLKKSFYIDHCHKTNLVRGLLCGRCNLAIGQFRDDIGLLLKAIEYIRLNGAI